MIRRCRARLIPVCSSWGLWVIFEPVEATKAIIYYCYSSFECGSSNQISEAAFETEWSTAPSFNERNILSICAGEVTQTPLSACSLRRLLLFSSWKPPQYLLIPFIESADNPTLPLSLWSAHYGVGFRASQWETGRAGEGDSCNLSPFLFWQSCSSNTLANHHTTHFSRLDPVLYGLTGQFWVTVAESRGKIHNWLNLVKFHRWTEEWRPRPRCLQTLWGFD